MVDAARGARVIDFGRIGKIEGKEKERKFGEKEEKEKYRGGGEVCVKENIK